MGVCHLGNDWRGSGDISSGPTIFLNDSANTEKIQRHLPISFSENASFAIIFFPIASEFSDAQVCKCSDILIEMLVPGQSFRKY